MDEQWDAATATDSDDEAGSPGSADFMSQYAAAMEAELSSSKIGTTFAKAEQPHTGGTGENALPCSHARLDKDVGAYTVVHSSRAHRDGEVALEAGPMLQEGEHHHCVDNQQQKRL